MISAEFIRRLQGSRLPADIAASAKLSDAPKDLRDWLLLECADISEDFNEDVAYFDAIFKGNNKNVQDNPYFPPHVPSCPAHFNCDAA